MHVSSLIDYNEASHINKMWLCAINAIGNSGVSCFILISGYYGVRFSKEKFWYLVVLTIIYTLIVSLLNNGVDVKKTSEAILGLPLYNVDLWFVVCYLALMLISPYINEMIEVLSEYNYRKMLVILCFLLSVVPTLFYFPSVNGVMLTQGGKCFSYFLFVYLIGRYIRLHKDINLKEIKRIKMAWGGTFNLHCNFCSYSGIILFG